MLLAADHPDLCEHIWRDLGPDLTLLSHLRYLEWFAADIGQHAPDFDWVGKDAVRRACVAGALVEHVIRPAVRLARQGREDEFLRLTAEAVGADRRRRMVSQVAIRTVQNSARARRGTLPHEGTRNRLELAGHPRHQGDAAEKSPGSWDPVRNLRQEWVIWSSAATTNGIS